MGEQEDANARLLSELSKLEGTLAKGGDALANAPHDGGFATEGINIQSRAKAMKKALRAMLKGGMAKGEAKKIIKAMYKADDDSSSSSSSDSSSVAKAIDDMSGDESSDDESSDGDESSDESSDDESSSLEAPPKKKMSKSTGAAAMANASSKVTKKKNDEIRKAMLADNPNAERDIDAVPILDSLIKQLDKGRKVTKSELGDLRKSIVDGQKNQVAFNTSVAKALTLIAGSVGSVKEDIAKALFNIKAIADQPAPRNSAQLRKGDIREPEFAVDTGRIDGTFTEVSPLTQLPLLKVQEALVDIVMKGEVPGFDIVGVTKFENSKGNLNELPPHVVKALEKRLCSAA